MFVRVDKCVLTKSAGRRGSRNGSERLQEISALKTHAFCSYPVRVILNKKSAVALEASADCACCVEDCYCFGGAMGLPVSRRLLRLERIDGQPVDTALRSLESCLSIEWTTVSLTESPT